MKGLNSARRKGGAFPHCAAAEPRWGSRRCPSFVGALAARFALFAEAAMPNSAAKRPAQLAAARAIQTSRPGR